MCPFFPNQQSAQRGKQAPLSLVPMHCLALLQSKITLWLLFPWSLQNAAQLCIQMQLHSLIGKLSFHHHFLRHILEVTFSLSSHLYYICSVGSGFSPIDRTCLSCASCEWFSCEHAGFLWLLTCLVSGTVFYLPSLWLPSLLSTYWCHIVD